MEWLGFWIFMSVLVVTDSWLFERGYNTMFHTHKTSEEKELQRLKIEKMKKEVGE